MPCGSFTRSFWCSEKATHPQVWERWKMKVEDMNTVSSSDIIFFFIHSVVFGSTGLHIDAPQDQTLHYEEFQSIFIFTILDKRGRTKPVINCKSKAELLQRLLRKKHLNRSSVATKLNMQRETLHHPLRRSMFYGMGHRPLWSLFLGMILYQP